MLSSVLPRAARGLESGMNNRWRPANGGATELHSSGPMAWSREGERERRAAYVPALPPSRDEGAERRVPLVDTSPVDADGGYVFASCSSRRRCSSYVVSSMLARLPAAGMGCLASSPSCAIYSQGKGMGIHSRDDRAEPLRCSGFDPHPPRRHGGCSRT